MSSQLGIRDCPSCEQGKHAICIEEVLGPDDPPGTLTFVPCPCAEREHKPPWRYKDIITGKDGSEESS